MKTAKTLIAQCFGSFFLSLLLLSSLCKASIFPKNISLIHLRPLLSRNSNILGATFSLKLNADDLQAANKEIINNTNTNILIMPITITPYLLPFHLIRLNQI